MLEKIVYNQLISYINENDVSAISQFGFRKSHATTTSHVFLLTSLLVERGSISKKMCVPELRAKD